MKNKFLKMVLVKAALAVAQIASANPTVECKEAKDLAKEVAIEVAHDNIGGLCEVVKTKENMRSKKQVGYKVDIRCEGEPLRSVSVVLEKDKSTKVCTAKRATLRPLPGSQCGLTDTWGGEVRVSEWGFDESRTQDVYTMSEKELRALPKHSQEQLIETAGDEAHGSVVLAVEFLRENSEGEEVYLEYFELHGVHFTAVSYYGGGNPTGMIFKEGSSKPIAVNSDEDILCVGTATK